NVGETTVSENLHGKALLAWAHPRRGSPVRLAHTSARASRASTGTVTFAAKGKRGSHLGIRSAGFFRLTNPVRAPCAQCRGVTRQASRVANSIHVRHRCYHLFIGGRLPSPGQLIG